MEGVQRSGTRSSPPVDGLVGVADGRHPGVGEEGGQEPDLGHRGVLELVEQDREVLGPHLGGGIGDGLGDGAGQGDLVTEVEQAVVTLVLAQLCDDVEQGLPLGHDGGRLADQGLAALDGGQGSELLGQVGQVLGGILDGQQVLAQGVAQDQGGARVVAEALVGQRERARLEQGGDDLPGTGLGDEGRVGVHADAQSVVAHQGAGEGVIGGDHRLADVRGVSGAHAAVIIRRGGREQAGRTEVGQAGGDALVELGGGLAGEGQSEDLVGADLPGGDQVDDPLGHGGGLARAGSGDHQEGAEPVGDDARLLLGGSVDAERCRQGLRSELARAGGGGHETTLLPSTWTGQESLTLQVRQCSPVRASITGPTPATAAEATRSSAQYSSLLRAPSFASLSPTLSVGSSVASVAAGLGSRAAPGGART